MEWITSKQQLRNGARYACITFERRLVVCLYKNNRWYFYKHMSNSLSDMCSTIYAVFPIYEKYLVNKTKVEPNTPYVFCTQDNVLGICQFKKNMDEEKCIQMYFQHLRPNPLYPPIIQKLYQIPSLPTTVDTTNIMNYKEPQKIKPSVLLPRIKTLAPMVHYKLTKEYQPINWRDTTVPKYYFEICDFCDAWCTMHYTDLLPYYDSLYRDAQGNTIVLVNAMSSHLQSIGFTLDQILTELGHTTLSYFNFATLKKEEKTRLRNEVLAKTQFYICTDIPNASTILESDKQSYGTPPYKTALILLQ